MTRWGLISTARINRKLLEGAAESDEVEVVAVASRDQARADAYARENGIERAYGSYEALLADPTIDAVYISLPNALHCPWSIRALEAGKHVLCEKPMSSDDAAVAAVFDVAHARGLHCMEAFMWRHNPQTRRLEQLVREGAIGELRMIRSDFGFTIDLEAGDVRLSSALDGGALGDLGCYCISATRLLGGEPLSVVARQVVAPSGVDMRIGAVLALPAGVLAEFHCGFDLPGRHALEVIGAEGSILVDDPWHCLRVGLTLTRAAVETIEIERANSYRLELEDLSRAIRGEGTPLLGRDDAIGQARTIAAVLEAARSGQAVQLPAS